MHRHSRREILHNRKPDRAKQRAAGLGWNHILLATAAVAAVAALDIARASGRARRKSSSRIGHFEYRSGFPRSPDQMRGIARDLQVPRDMRSGFYFPLDLTDIPAGTA